MVKNVKYIVLSGFLTYFLSQMAWAQFPPYLNLLVGGVPYQNVPLNLLLSSQPSVLSSMFSPDKFSMSKITSDGYYIVDGNGALFAKILNFLRFRFIPVDNKNELYELFYQARYYCLQNLTAHLAKEIWDITPESDRAGFPLDIWREIPDVRLSIIKKSIQGKKCYGVFNQDRKTTIGKFLNRKDILQEYIDNRKNITVCAPSKYCDLPYNVLTGTKIGLANHRYDLEYNKSFNPMPFMTHIVGSFMCSFYQLNEDQSVTYAICNIMDGSLNFAYFETLDECVEQLQLNYKPY